MTAKPDRYPELTAGLLTEFPEDSMATEQPEGFLAVSPSNGGRPVLMLHPWWGLNDTMKDVCRKIASAGYIVFAPDLFGGKVARTIPEAENLIRAADSDQVRDIVLRGAAFVRTRAGSADLSVVGFSYGAAFALDLSATDPDVRSVVIFYGTAPADLSRSRAEYLVHLAENDPYEPAENVEQLIADLKKGGRPATFHQYAGTGHWFFEPDRADAYRKDAADLAWERTLAFLQKPR